MGLDFKELERHDKFGLHEMRNLARIASYSV